MPSTPPFVSGIVAAYNYGRYLPDALDSALAQDYPADRLEVIVVDDGSTDDTAQIAQDYERRSDGVVRYVRQENAGLCAATSRGVALARGEFITLLDADDAWLASRTRLLVDALARNPDAGIVYGDMEVIDADGATIAPSWWEEINDPPFRGRALPRLLRTNFVMAPSLMIRADLAHRFAPIPAAFPVQDWYMAARVSQVADVDFVPATVARYRRHGANMNNGQFDPAATARIFRRDIVIRRWMLAHLRARDLTVDDLAGAYGYFMHTLSYAAGQDRVPVETLLEVTSLDRRRHRRQLDAGRVALSAGDHRDAASHFLAALAADPFDEKAQLCLEHAQRRLVVPLPRGRGAGARTDDGIAAGYRRRDAAEYPVDLQRSGASGVSDVYAVAGTVADRLGAARVIELGAGGGRGLAALRPRFQILGLDHGPNVELARRSFPAEIWRDHDLEGDEPLPLSEAELAGSVVVCANVLERLHDPRLVLGRLSQLLPSLSALILSTPDRDLVHGPGHLGPPDVDSRIREWNIHEFSALLEAAGFGHGTLSHARVAGAGSAQHAVLAVLYPDATSETQVGSAPVLAAA